MGQKYEEVFETWEVAVAKPLVARFRAKWPCLEEDNFDSLVGECLVQWLIAKPTHDSSRGASERTYMAKVVHNKLVDLVRERTTLKYKMLSEAASLHEERSDKDEGSLTRLERIDAITVPFAPRDPYADALLKRDLSKVLASLTPRQKRVCGLLATGKTKTEASEALGISRDTLYEELKRIRQIFKRADLDSYVK